MALKKSLRVFSSSAFVNAIRGVMKTEKEEKPAASRSAHSRCPYLQCSQEVPTLSYSAASSAQRGQSPDSDSVAGPLWGGSGPRALVGLLPWGGDWGSSPKQPLSPLSCRDCNRPRYLPMEAPACGSIDKPALLASMR